MRRVNWTVTEAQHQALKQLSQKTGLSISELVRRSLDTYIQALSQDQKTDPAIVAPTPTKGTDDEQPNH